jgi:hypothetical protein
MSIDHLFICTDVGAIVADRLAVFTPVRDRPSPAWQAVLDTQQVQLAFGTQFCIELGFDGEVQGQRLDCRLALPLVLCW